MVAESCIGQSVRNLTSGCVRWVVVSNLLATLLKVSSVRRPLWCGQFPLPTDLRLDRTADLLILWVIMNLCDEPVEGQERRLRAEERLVF